MGLEKEKQVLEADKKSLTDKLRLAESKSKQTLLSSENEAINPELGTTKAEKERLETEKEEIRVQKEQLESEKQAMLIELEKLRAENMNLKKTSFSGSGTVTPSTLPVSSTNPVVPV